MQGNKHSVEESRTGAKKTNSLYRKDFSLSSVAWLKCGLPETTRSDQEVHPNNASHICLYSLLLFWIAWTHTDRLDMLAETDAHGLLLSSAYTSRAELHLGVLSRYWHDTMLAMKFLCFLNNHVQCVNSRRKNQAGHIKQQNCELWRYHWHISCVCTIGIFCNNHQHSILVNNRCIAKHLSLLGKHPDCVVWRANG